MLSTKLTLLTVLTASKIKVNTMKNIITALTLTAIASTAMATPHTVNRAIIDMNTGSVLQAATTCQDAGIQGGTTPGQAQACLNLRNRSSDVEYTRTGMHASIANFVAQAPAINAQEITDATAARDTLIELDRLLNRYDEVIRLIREWDAAYRRGVVLDYSRACSSRLESHDLRMNQIPAARTAMEAARTTFTVLSGNWGAYFDAPPTLNTNTAGMFYSMFYETTISNARCDVFQSSNAAAMCRSAIANIVAPSRIQDHIGAASSAATTVNTLEAAFYTNEVVPAQAEFATVNAEHDVLDPQVTHTFNWLAEHTPLVNAVTVLKLLLNRYLVRLSLLKLL